MIKLLSGKRIALLVLALFFVASSGFSKLEKSNKKVVAEKRSLYNDLQLAELGLKQNVFDEAITGWTTLQKQNRLQNPGILSIADMSQSSKSKRLYVIDMERGILLFNTYVAHGRNTGEEFARLFANQPDSYKSSLGFYVTGSTYEGAHGLSLKLKGIENGINDCAEKRGIVMHGAAYVSESFIQQNGRLGRSQGCPAVSEELCKPIVNFIKDGSCFFMFYPDENYLKQSKILSAI